MSSKQRSRNEISSSSSSSSSKRINGGGGCRRRRLKPRLLDPETFKNEAEVGGGGGGGKNLGVLEKLEALKKLIPSKTGEVKADQLFEETADYIVFLKTQVEILQKLIDFYDGSSSSSSPTTNDHQNNHHKVVVEEEEEEEVVS